MKLAGTDVKGTVPVVAKTEPEMAPNRSGVTVPPGNTGLADAGVVGAHKNEAATSAIATTPSCSDFMPSRALPRLRSDKAANKFDVSAGKSRRCAGHRRQDRGQYQNRAGGNRPLTLPQAWPAQRHTRSVGSFGSPLFATSTLDDIIPRADASITVIPRVDAPITNIG